MSVVVNDSYWVAETLTQTVVRFCPSTAIFYTFPLNKTLGAVFGPLLGTRATCSIMTPPKTIATHSFFSTFPSHHVSITRRKQERRMGSRPGLPTTSRQNNRPPHRHHICLIIMDIFFRSIIYKSKNHSTKIQARYFQL